MRSAGIAIVGIEDAGAALIDERSPRPSLTASWLRPRSRGRRNDLDGRIVIGNSRGELLAHDVGGEQTLNIGKAGEIAQKVAPSPGPVVSLVTSAHAVTREGSCSQPAPFILSLKL